MVRAVFLLLVLLCPEGAAAQILDLEWERYFDSQRVPSDDWLAMATSDAHHQILVSGTTGPLHDRSILTASFDADGNLRWRSTFEAERRAAVLSILAGSNGDTYVAICSPVDDVHSELLLVKYDGSGNEEWVRAYPDLDLRSDYRVRLGLASDRMVIVGGTARDSAFVEFGFIFKLNASGERLWFHHLDARFGGIVDLVTRPGGSTFVAGWANDPTLSFRRSTVRRYDADGNELWAATPLRGGAATHLRFTPDGRLFAAGTFRGMFVTELDPDSGKVLRITERSDADVLVDFEIGADGAAYLTGYEITTSVCKDECPNDFITVKVDPEGKSDWSNRYEGTLCCISEHPTDLFLHEGSAYVTGFSRGVVLLRYDAETGAEESELRKDDGGKLHLLTAATGFVVARHADRPDRGLDFEVAHLTSTGEVTWASHLDGERHSSEHASAFVVDDAGNSFVAAQEGLIVSFDRFGEIRWETTCGDAGASCRPVDLAIDPNRTLYVAALVEESGNRTFRVVSYEMTGDLNWSAGYDGAGNGYDNPSGLVLDGDGGVIVFGESKSSDTYPDVTLVRYNADGTEAWASRISDWADGIGRPFVVRLDEEGSVIVTGSGHAARLDGRSGELLWHEVRINTSADQTQHSFAPRISSGDVLVPSSRDEIRNFVRVTIPTLVRFSEDGRSADVVDLDQGDLEGLRVSGIVADPEGNFYLGGLIHGAPVHYVAAKYGSDGRLLWSRRYSRGEGMISDGPSEIRLSENGTLSLLGTYNESAPTWRGGLLLEYDREGNLVTELRTRERAVLQAVGFGRDAAGALYLGGTGGSNLSVFKYAAGAGVDAAPHPRPFEPAIYPAFPNPTSGEFFVTVDSRKPQEATLVVVDALGRAVLPMRTILLGAGRNELTINLRGNASGTYFYRLVLDGRRFASSVVVLR